jgi:type II secretory pathway component PulC
VWWKWAIAVLFELNGVTQRIYLGETIGSTGWSLVEVAKDSAILRRNGEVRTIGVGQKI